MKNIFLITQREYLTQVKKKAFVLLTVFTPILLIAFGALITFMMKANETKHTFNVVDKSGIFKTTLKSTDKITYVFVPINTEASLKSSLKEMESTDGLLIIPALKDQNFDALENHTQLYINKKIGFDTKTKITSDLIEGIKREKIKSLGLTEMQIQNLDKGFDLYTKNVVDNNKTDSDVMFGVKTGLGMVMMYAVFMFIIIYGVRVMRSVLEEKNNRVVEILISSVKPFELMLGKILGVTFVALTQFIVWIAMSVAAALVFNTGFAAMQNNPAFSNLNILQIFETISHTLLDLNYPLIIFVFITFFLLGYIFYSSMYAAIGSAVDNETETQQFTLFAIIPLMLGVYGSFTIINNPDGPTAFWLSIIPFTSPIAMTARIPFGVPVWELVLSISLLLITCFAMIFIAAKIYRVGILMYGNKATLKELWKWIKSS